MVEKPDVPLHPQAFTYLGCRFLMAGVVCWFLGIKTKGKSIEQIDREHGRHRLTFHCLTSHAVV